jgi:D-glycero-alpha-D-manno-heptose 1-phosphate guanylyltransferase
MEAIILAGGFGTRLSHIVKDVPKPMAPVNGKPFITYVIKFLIEQGVNKIVMAVGYKKESIITYFGEKYAGCEIAYSDEDKPLFTGGAIKKALRQCTNKNIIILNGDTFFEVELKKMLESHKNNCADITVACKPMKSFDRYGTVNIKNERIVGFNEKVYMESGIINGGVYIVKRNLLEDIKKEKFSFETDFMEKNVLKRRVCAFLSDGYFIDIGIEKDYYKAQEDFKRYE